MTGTTDPPPPRTILIVDDDPAQLEGLETIFRDAGDNPIACATFEEARTVVRGQHIDALVTDIRLGAYNGLQLLLMARDIQRNVRAIVFSGFDDPVLKAEAERIGATYLLKPVSGREMLRVLENGFSTP